MRLFLMAAFLLIQGISSAQTADSAFKNNVIKDTLPLRAVNVYGDLLDDDPKYNPRYSPLLTSGRVLAADVFNWSVARYIYNFEWAHVTSANWKRNFKEGPEWDEDKFGINFIGHPHTGNYYHNIARSNGYSYWQSLPFAIQGSVTWEYFGENTRPSWNDMINTPISGMFIGEVLYRLSSNVLDDRTHGRERVFREILAGLINPPRALNRLTQGKMRRTTPYEVYQKEPLNILINAGAHRINRFTDFASGATNAILNLQLDYGNPFETRKRKPFDLFRFRTDLSYGSNRRLLENVNGYGILAGRNIKKDRLLAGIFQHFDYWNNNTFEVGSLGFGGGLISRMPLATKSNIYSNIHLAVVPLAGNNTQYGPDTSEVRKYNFGGGFQAKMEERINLNEWASIGFTAFYYWIHTYNGLPGNSLVGILKPAISLRIYKNLNVGFEHQIYKNDRFLKNDKNIHLTRTEQKLYLQLFLEDKTRKGKYH